MQNSNRTFKKIAAVAALGAIVLAGTVQPARAQAAAGQTAAQGEKKKNYKDNAEFELYSSSATAIGANNFAKALTDLNTWKQKYPQTEFQEERTLLYVQAYSGSKDFAKAVDAAGEVMSKDLATAFADPANALRLLVVTAVAIQNVQAPTPEQLAIGEKAGRALLTYDRKPAGVDDAAWATARTQLQNAGKAALLYVAVVPGNQAMAKNDCEAAQSAFAKALADYPDNAFVTYNLGQAYFCTMRKDPSKRDEMYPKAIYEFVRAIVLDPTLGGTQPDAKKMTDTITKTYVNFHGSEEGLAELKEKVKAAPVVPADFTIESSTAVSARKEKEFADKYPQLALWLRIKGQLAGANGAQYFQTELKDADVPKMKGTVVEGKPACRSKEILISVPEPDQQGTAPSVITLKLDTALTGKPEAGEIQWKGVPSAFTPEPFMLTMETEKANIEGLKTSACAAGPARPAGKKGAATKKK